MAGNQQEKVKKFNTRDQNLGRQQRDKILLQMKDAWRNWELFSKLLPNQQTAGTDAILLRYRHLHFDYSLKTITTVNEFDEKSVEEKYIFETTIPVIGTEDLKAKIKTEISKPVMDRL